MRKGTRHWYFTSEVLYDAHSERAMKDVTLLFQCDEEVLPTWYASSWKFDLTRTPSIYL